MRNGWSKVTLLLLLAAVPIENLWGQLSPDSATPSGLFDEIDSVHVASDTYFATIGGSPSVLRIWKANASARDSVGTSARLITTFTPFKRLWRNMGDHSLIYVSDGSHAEVVSLNDLNQPLLTELRGLPPSTSEAWRIIDSDGVGIGFAIKTALDSVADGKPGEWKLFVRGKDGRFHELSLDGGPPVISEFARIGNGKVCVRGVPERKGEDINWSCYHQSQGRSWVRDRSLDGLFIHTITTFKDSGIIAMEVGNSASSGTKWVLFHTDPSGALQPIDLPSSVYLTGRSAAQSYGWKFISVDRASATGPRRSYFYYEETVKKWVGLEDYLNVPVGTITDVRIADDGSAFAVLGGSNASSAIDDWKIYIVDNNGDRFDANQGASTVLQPGRIWDVKFLRHACLAVAMTDLKSGGSGATWKILNYAGGVFADITTQYLPGTSVVSAVTSLQDGSVLELDEIGPKLELRSSFFLDSGTDYRRLPVEEFLSAGAGTVSGVYLGENFDVARVDLSSGHSKWLLRSDPRSWRKAEDMLVEDKP